MDDNKKGQHQRIASLHQAALKLSESGEIQTALELLKRALELDNVDASTYVLIGLTYQNMGEFKEAEEYFFKAVEIDPKNAEAMQSLGLFLIAQERKAEGVEWLRKYIERGYWYDEDNFDKVVSLLDELGHQQDALAFLSTAWEKTLTEEIGRLYARRLELVGRQDDANWIWKLVALRPQEAKDYYSIGLELRDAKRYKDAIRYLEAAIDLANETKFAAPGFSWEEYEVAGDTWPYKLPDEPELGLYEYFIACCYLDLKDGENALHAIDKSIKWGGVSLFDYLRRAETLILLEKYEEAILDIDKGLVLLGENEDTKDWGESLYLDKNFALLSLGKNAAALETLLQGNNKYPASVVLASVALAFLMVKSMDSELIRVFEQTIRKGGKLASPYIDWYINSLDRCGQQIIPDDIKECLTQGKSAQDVASSSTMLLPALYKYPALADDYLQYFIKRFPENAFLLHLQAWMMISQNNLQKPETLLSKALVYGQTASERQYLLNNLGYICLLTGKFIEAEKHFSNILETKGEADSEKYPDILEVAFCQNGKVIPDHLPRLVRKVTPRLAAYANQAALALARGEFDSAAKFAIQALALQPDNSLGYELLGFISMARGDSQTARAAFEQALKKADNPASTEALEELLHRVLPESESNRAE